MDEHHISRFESYIAKLIEGAFVSVFRESANMRNIAAQIARVMENNLNYADHRDPRPIAPHQYLIRLSPTLRQQLAEEYPELTQSLSQYIVDLTVKSEYRLIDEPLIEIVDDPNLKTGMFSIECAQVVQNQRGTTIMQSVDVPLTEVPPPQNPQIIIDGEKIFFLDRKIIDIGRSPGNDIVIDDPYASRHHVQLRLRFGGYTIFDVNSKSGTYVNNVRIDEYQLQSGDVIRIGRTQIVYFEDAPHSRSTTSTMYPSFVD